MRIPTRLFFLLTPALFVFAQPWNIFPVPGPGVLTIRNAASNSSASSVAPGSFVALGVSSFIPLAFTSADGYTVGVTTSDGVTTNLVPILPPDAGKSGMSFSLWIVLPPQSPLGSATATLFRNGAPFAGPASLEITAAATPGLFTKNYLGYGPALALNSNTLRNAFTNAAVPRDHVALFATGLGSASAGEVTIELAGQSFPADYAGPQGLPGLDQINLTIPANPYMGCYVPVAIRVRGLPSNQATLAINSDSYACAHPLGVSYGDLQTLDADGVVPIARFEASSFERASRSNEYASLSFLRGDSDSMFELAHPQMPESPYLSCPAADRDNVTSVQSDYKDAGRAVALTGTGGRSLSLTSTGYGKELAGELVPFFAPGSWQISAPGGTDVSSFSQSFWLPPLIHSVNLTPHAVIPSKQDFVLTWDPTGFRPSDIVTVELPSLSSGLCRARAADGKLTLPRSIWESRAPTTGEFRLTVGPHPAARTQFSLRNMDGSTTAAYVTYAFTLSIPVVIQ